MKTITFARYIAIFMSVVTLFFLFLHRSFRTDNIFLVPDIILCCLLIISAVLPKKIAPVAMLFSFGLASGVFITSVSQYIVQGELGIPSIIAAVGSLAASGILIHTIVKKN